MVWVNMVFYFVQPCVNGISTVNSGMLSRRAAWYESVGSGRPKLPLSAVTMRWFIYYILYNPALIERSAVKSCTLSHREVW